MNRRLVVGFILLMVVDVTAQVAFKFAAVDALPLAFDLGWVARVFGQPWVYLAVLAYGATFFIWIGVLREAPVGPAFAASHLEIVVVMAVSVYLFQEPLSAPKLIGAALILLGIVCLAASEARLATAVKP